jgi:hypothetical protein
MSKYGSITDTKTHVQTLLSSVDTFEMNGLTSMQTGRNSVYQRLNSLIAAYGLVNTTGPDYAPLEASDSGDPNKTSEEKGRSKFRSLYPGIFVTTTVEGNYANLRRFIREIVTGQDFIVISSVQLEPSETEKKNNPATQPAPAAPGLSNPPIGGAPGPVQTGDGLRRQGKTHGETVSLRLEMAAYFRRPTLVRAVQ